ncbi:hypothetical protein AMS68_002628 [Peltaster fructicola]|uniref:TLC domain-containing protein n=1 Tax=Peltaster fructicola TaxID=286661 RepID=A0A6H0XR30_9PEZI|nr:hypothetical protein AMS68_002628 [Peltaster fructicola]
MLDPFAVKLPEPLARALETISTTLSLPTLQYHGHEVLFALSFYTFIFIVVSPWLNKTFMPKRYASFNKRTRINWDVHVVSFVQSTLICILSLAVILGDKERKQWRSSDQWEMRIFGYTGLTGLCQSFALGYFLWDLYMCTFYINIFGPGMLAHAISAVTVFSFGFRPFLYYWAPVFLLYELSSPFLNIHWFCDKLELTGSTIQAVNGAFLVLTFFCCRLVWGTYSSVLVFYDVWRAIQGGYTEPRLFEKFTAYAREGDLSDPQGQTTAFMGVRYLPLWLGSAYLASNLVLNVLNYYWFSKMVQTIRKRFDPPFGTKGIGEDKVEWEHVEKKKGSVKAAREKAEAVTGRVELDDAATVQRGVYADGHTSVEVTGSTRRTTTSRRKA